MAFNPVKTLAKLGVKGAVNTTKFVGKTALKDVKRKDGQVSKTLGNIYTGKKLNPVHVGVASAAYLGGSFFKENVEHKSMKQLDLATKNDMQNYGAPDILSYDGVSQQRAPQNLNANGSLVFGLHNSRKG